MIDIARMEREVLNFAAVWHGYMLAAEIDDVFKDRLPTVQARFMERIAALKMANAVEAAVVDQFADD